MRKRKKLQSAHSTAGVAWLGVIVTVEDCRGVIDRNLIPASTTTNVRLGRLQEAVSNSSVSCQSPCGFIHGHPPHRHRFKESIWSWPLGWPTFYSALAVLVAALCLAQRQWLDGMRIKLLWWHFAKAAVLLPDSHQLTTIPRSQVTGCTFQLL